MIAPGPPAAAVSAPAAEPPASEAAATRPNHRPWTVRGCEPAEPRKLRCPASGGRVAEVPATASEIAASSDETTPSPSAAEPAAVARRAASQTGPMSTLRHLPAGLRQATASTCTRSMAPAREASSPRAMCWSRSPAAAPATRHERSRRRRRDAEPIQGPAAALVDYMERSRDIPTATSFRTIGVGVLDAAAGRSTAHSQRRATRIKVSFTHLIGYAIARAADASPR